MRRFLSMFHRVSQVVCRPVFFPIAGLLAVIVLMLQPVQMGFSTADVLLLETGIFIFLVSLLLLLLRRCSFHLTAVDLLLGLWLVYMILRAWFTPSVPCFPAVARVLSLAVLYAALRLLFSSVYTSSRVVEGVVLLFVCLECLLCVYQLFIGTSRHSAYPITGSFLNPGPCSAVFLVGACLGLCRFFFPVSSRIFSPWRASVAFPLFTVLLCFLLLPLGWSRAALVSGLCCLLLSVWPHLSARLRLSVVVALLFVGVLLYLSKRGSADGRVLFWLVSSRSVASHPLFGSGMDSFFLAYSRATAALHGYLPGMLSVHADTLDYALADVVRVAVEQGIWGVVLALMSVFIVFFRLRKRSQPLALSLLGLLFFSLFSYPFQQLPFQLFFILMASFAATPDESDASACSRNGFIGHAAMALVGSILAVSSACLLLSPVRRHVRAVQESRLIVGRNNTRLLDEYARLHPLMRHDAGFLFRYGQMLASCGRYNESNHILWQGTLVSNDAMFHVLRGHNYMHLQAYAQARRAYRLAHVQSPSRLYPLYCLMRFYRRVGQHGHAVRVARVLLDMPLQPNSSLARKIRDEARKCLCGQ